MRNFRKTLGALLLTLGTFGIVFASTPLFSASAEGGSSGGGGNGTKLSGTANSQPQCGYRVTAPSLTTLSLSGSTAKYDGNAGSFSLTGTDASSTTLGTYATTGIDSDPCQFWIAATQYHASIQFSGTNICWKGATGRSAFTLGTSCSGAYSATNGFYDSSASGKGLSFASKDSNSDITVTATGISSPCTASASSIYVGSASSYLVTAPVSTSVTCNWKNNYSVGFPSKSDMNNQTGVDVSTGLTALSDSLSGPTLTTTIS
jgi:hypothetical protein